VSEPGDVWMDDDTVATLRATTESGFDSMAQIQKWTPGPESDLGNETGAWESDGDPVPAMFVHEAGTEVTTNRDTQIADWFVRLPYGTPLTGSQQIVDLGQDPPVTFQVVGPPTDQITHLRAELSHIEG